MNYDDLRFHPESERLVDILCTKTGNQERMFFRILLTYYWGVVAAQMRASIVGFNPKGEIPINIYALNLSPSGTGKGYSTSTMEREVLNQFTETFLEHTFPQRAELNLQYLADKRASRHGTDPDDERAKLQKEFDSLGSLLFSFDSATTPAVKQMRQKLLLGNAGAVNLQIDEIGANLLGQSEVLTTFLELYDKGLVKEKLTKSTADSVRFERITGTTPTNMLLFGTPTKLLDGGQTEAHLMDMLEMGYARRCFFGLVRHTQKTKLTPEELLELQFNEDNDAFLEVMAARFGILAEMQNLDKRILIPKDVCLEVLKYKAFCEERGEQYGDHEAIKKAEMDHRYFKVLKLAGAYAFIDQSPEITVDHVEYAIAIAEASGKAIEDLLSAESNHVRLAKFLAQCKEDITLADLEERLPYFKKGSRTQKDEMITLAIAWGYKHNIVIKKTYNEGILFLNADALEPTNLDKLILSWSSDMTRHYANDYAPFDKIENLLKLKGHHWLNHHLARGDVIDPETNKYCGYRKEDNVLPGFNLLVLDIDGTCPLSTAQLLLKDFTAIYQTTKSHTEETNRYRILLPMAYTLKLSAPEFKEFFNNVIESLPFEIDESCNHRSKKWLTNSNAEIIYNEGELFDPLPYIPMTSRNEERKRIIQDQQSLDNLERWVINNIGDGNRNTQLHKYAMILVDAGLSLEAIRNKVLDLNAKIASPLKEDELTATIFTTVSKALASR